MIFLPFSDDDNEAPVQVRLQSVSCDVIVRGFVAKIAAKLRYKNNSDRLLQVRKKQHVANITTVAGCRYNNNTVLITCKYVHNGTVEKIIWST